MATQQSGQGWRCSACWTSPEPVHGLASAMGNDERMSNASRRRLIALRPPRFVIAQTGHSGSGYIARVLTAAGIDTGHEDWFRPGRRRVSGLVGDSSWCAVPELGSFRGTVFHQVRAPLPTLRSLAAAMSQPDTDRNRPYRRIVERALDVRERDDPIRAAMLRYLEFNRMSEQRAIRRWQVESVSVEDIECVANSLGIDVPIDRARAALRTVPTNVNKHDVPDQFDWDDLPASTLATEVREMAARYGYDVP